MELLAVLSELRGKIHLSPERLGMRRGGPVMPGREQDGRGPESPEAICGRNVTLTQGTGYS